MSQPVEQDVALILGGYESAEAATADWKRLRKLNVHGDARLYDIAVVQRSADGTVSVVKDLHHKVRRGLMIGGVLALTTPVGLSAGLVGGAAVGEASARLHKGLSKQDIEGLAALIDRNTVMLIALTNMELAGTIRGAIQSTDVTVQTMRTSTADFTHVIGELGLND